MLFCTGWLRPPSFIAHAGRPSARACHPAGKQHRSIGYDGRSCGSTYLPLTFRLRSAYLFPLTSRLTSVCLPLKLSPMASLGILELAHGFSHAELTQALRTRLQQRAETDNSAGVAETVPTSLGA